MSAVQYIVALAILTAPPTTSTSTNPEDINVIATLSPVLQQVAIEFEILDPREAKYLFDRREDYLSTLKVLRQRYQNLADAPRVKDSYRFPDRGAVNQLRSFNRAFRQSLAARLAVESGRESMLREAMQETDRLFQIWDELHHAKNDNYYVTIRRESLKRLRDLVGKESYYAGVMPPCVPIWRFQSID
jgi:hypothetical protein